MTNFESIKIPKTPTNPTHTVIEDTYFVPDEYLKLQERIINGIIIPPSTLPKIQENLLVSGTGVIVIEHGIRTPGTELLWDKILIKNPSGVFVEGFILDEKISNNTDTNQFLIPSTLQQYQPDYSAPFFSWRDNKYDTVLVDRRSGKYYFIYDTGRESVADDFEQLILFSLIKGIQEILSENGKQSNQEYIEFLQENYYLFGSVEAIDMPLRECSSLRVVVSVPMRYVHSPDVFDLIGDEWKTPEDGNFDDLDFEDEEPPPPDEEKNYDVITFYNHDEYNSFFNKLIKLDKPFSFEKDGLFNSINNYYVMRQWEIDPPEISINFSDIINQIAETKNKIIQYILENIPVERIPYSLSLIEEEQTYFWKYHFSGVDREKFNKDPIGLLKKAGYKTAAEVFRDAKIELSRIKLLGQISIQIDLDTFVISKVSFSPQGKDGIGYGLDENSKIIKEVSERPKSINKESIFRATGLTYNPSVSKKIGYVSRPIKNVRAKKQFLNSEICKNSTIVNYLVSANNNISFMNVEDNSFFKILHWNPSKLLSIPSDGSALESPDKVICDFIKAYHYPKVEEIVAQPFDLTKCVQDLKSTINETLSNRTFDALKKWQSAIEKENNDQFKIEGDVILNAINGTFDNRNLRIIFGVDAQTNELIRNDPLAAIRNNIVPALRELNIFSILAELFKCATLTISQEDLATLLASYSFAKDFLSQMAFSSVCNPYVKNVFDEVNFPQLPIIETYNPNANLSRELTKHFVKTLQDILLASTRELLKASMNLCVTDNSQKEPEGNSAGADLLDALNSGDNANINNLLDDLFGASGQNNGLPLDEAKEQLSNIINDFNCFVSPKELCDLLNGKTVSDEIYQVMLKIVEKKYPELFNRNSLTTREEIKRLFITLGNNINLNFCEDIQNTPQIPISCGCDDGTLDASRRLILENKGLPKDAIEDIINDIKSHELKKVNDILKYLNSDQPDFSNLPASVCKKSKDGSVIPPAVDLSTSVESFKKMLSTLVDDTYDVFDNEAKSWSRVTYSISSSNPPNISFERGTGKVVASSQINSGETGTEILPSYLFNDILQNSKFSFKNAIYQCFVDGDMQQKLDAAFIDKTLKDEINVANVQLTNFLENFFQLIEVYLIIAGLDITAGLTSSALVGKFQNSMGKLWNEIVGLTTGSDSTTGHITDFSKMLVLFDSFIRNPGVKSQKKYQTISTMLGDNADSIALFTKNNGIPIFLTIAEVLKKHQSIIEAFIERVYNLVQSSSQGLEQRRSTELIEELRSVLKQYDNVEKIYTIVFNSAINFPEYNIRFMENYNPNDQVQSLSSLGSYEKYRVDITKNLEPSFILENFQYLDDDISNYIRNELGIITKNPNKEEVFDKFINNKNNNFSFVDDFQSYYYMISERMMNQVAFSMKNNNYDDYENNPFLSRIKVVEGTSSTPQKPEEKPVVQPPSYKAITDYISIVLEGVPTPKQKSCKIRPHYLDIDNIKDEIVEKKKNSVCIEEIVNDKVRNNLEVNTEELKNLNRNNTQNNLLSSLFKLCLRVYVHEILLRGIGTFGYYDPQYLIKDNLFVDFITNIIESEIRGVDNTFYEMMINFYGQYNNEQNPDKQIDLKDIQALRKNLKDVIYDDLRKSVLPKMSKRIMDDTNKKLSQFNIKVNLNKIHSLRELIEVLNLQNFIKEKQLDNGESYIYILPYGIKIFDGKIDQITDSNIEFRLLFDYIFPIRRYITLMFITNVMCTSTRKSIIYSFNRTKISLRNLCKTVMANGQPITPNPKNPQDLSNAEKEVFDWEWMYEALIKTPLMIAKGFMESTDANVQVSVLQHKVIKMLDKNYPSWTIPAVGVPLGITALIFGWVPFTLNIYNSVYYMLGLWNDDILDTKQESDADKFIKSVMDKALEEPADCEQEKKHSDIINIDETTGYVLLNDKEPQ